jgi:hypothetical protein
VCEADGKPDLSELAGIIVRMLSVKDHMTLAVAGQRWHHRGLLEQHVRDVFSEPATRFHARVDRLLDDPAALVAYPQLVRRLQRLRDQRRTVRQARYAS